MPLLPKPDPDTSAALQRYLTVKEVATLARCEHKAVRRAIHEGQLQAFQPANKLLVREQDAHAWIQSRPPRFVPGAPSPPARARRRNSPAAGNVARLRELEQQQLTIETLRSV